MVSLQYLGFVRNSRGNKAAANLRPMLYNKEVCYVTYPNFQSQASSRCRPDRGPLIIMIRVHRRTESGRPADSDGRQSSISKSIRIWITKRHRDPRAVPHKGEAASTVTSTCGQSESSWCLVLTFSPGRCVGQPGLRISRHGSPQLQCRRRQRRCFAIQTWVTVKSV